MGNNTYVGIKFTEDCEQFKLKSTDKFNLKYVPFSPLHAEMNLYKLPKRKGDKREKLAVLYTKFQFTRFLLSGGGVHLAGLASYYGLNIEEMKTQHPDSADFKLGHAHEILRHGGGKMVSLTIWSWIKILKPVFRMKSFEQNLIVSSKLKGKSSGNTFVFFLCNKKVQHVTLSYIEEENEGWYLIYNDGKTNKKYPVTSQMKQKTRHDDYAMLGSVDFNVKAPPKFPTPVVVMSQYIVENMNNQVIGIVIRNALKKWKENKKSRKSKKSKNKSI